MIPGSNNGTSAPITEGIATLWVEGHVRELFVLGATKRGTITGYYDDQAALVRDAISWDGQGHVHLTLNAVNPLLLHRAPNTWRDWTPKGEAVGDADVLHRLWLGIDIDPAIPKGIPANEGEHLATVAVRDAIATWLEAAQGWPAGLRGRSGNGSNLLYRIDLANTPEMTACIRGVLRALKDRFTTAGATIDESVADAAQLWRIYGTANIKGVASPERPHRRAQIDTQPTTWTVVTPEQLAAVAALSSTGSKGRARSEATGASTLLDAIRARGWYLDDLGDGKHSMVCPWASGHSVESPPSATCYFQPSAAHARGVGSSVCMPRAPSGTWPISAPCSTCPRRLIRRRPSRWTTSTPTRSVGSYTFPRGISGPPRASMPVSGPCASARMPTAIPSPCRRVRGWPPIGPSSN